jgi:hypothetical protein
MTLEEVQQWITTTWIRCQDEVWRQLPTPKKVSKDDQEPVAWMHNVIEGNVITHMPADIGRHPERWTALYKDPTPCKTCESLAMAVMNDQTYHEKVIAKRKWVGLTDQEVMVAAYQAGFDIHEDYENEDDPEAMHWWTPDGEACDDSLLKLRDLIEAKLKEKNHG